MANHQKKVIVVGAGVAGLTAAFRLQQQGYAVTVLERSGEVGGRMKTIKRDGFLYDVGTGLLPTAYTATSELIRDLGLSDRVEHVTGNMIIPRGGKLHSIALARQQWSLLTSSLLTLRSKLSLIKPGRDAARLKDKLSFDNLAAAADWDTESAADYCRRTLPAEALDYMIGPTIRAIYLHGPETCSVVELFWTLKNLASAATFSLKGGMSALPEAMAARLDVQFNRPVVKVERKGDGVEVFALDAGGQPQCLLADHAVIALDGKDLLSVYVDSLTAEQKHYLTQLGYLQTITVQIATSVVPALDAVLISVPEKENPDLGSIVLDHKKGSDRAPAGKGLVTIFMMAEASAPFFDADDATIVRHVQDKTKEYIPEVSTHLEHALVYRWNRAATVSTVGTFKRLRRFMADIDERSPVQIAGDFFSLSCVNASVVTAHNAVQRILARDRGATPS